MSKPTDQENQAYAEAVADARSALDAGRMREARRHIVRAEGMRPARKDTLRLLRRELQLKENAQRGRTKTSTLRGFGLALLGYLCLSLQQPPGWGVPLWGLLAFGVVPGVSGWFVGRAQGPESDPRNRFWSSAQAVGAAMAFYAGILLLILRARFRSGGDTGQVVFVWLLVIVVYAALAGLVAGVVSAKLTWFTRREERA